jgi:predicted metalloendopeptidase
MWKMADAFVPYLSVKFREVVKIYTAELIGEKDSPPRWETCVSLLQKFMGFGVSASIEPQIENKDNVVAVVNEIFYNIKETIRSYIDSNEHLESELRSHVLGKVRTSKTLKIFLGYTYSS